MQTVLWILATNTLVACGLAMLALLASRLGRPALAHVIWLLVIAKLLTPPLWRVPIRVADTNPLQPAATATWHGRPAHEVQPISVTRHFTGEAPVPQLPATVAPTARKPVPWRVIITSAGSTGALIYLMFAIGRIVAFRRLVTQSPEKLPGLAKEVELLATKIGLPHPPRIIVTAAPVSPMLMFLGVRPTFIAPATLMRSLDDDQRKAVIVHELAHLRRGDHWVRFFELIATALLWWHPLLWLARFGLHAAEEQCCDAWVVAILPDSRRRYADALVDATEWISRRDVPAVASGLGQLHNLRRRLTMIVDRTPPRSLSFAGRLSALALVAALPLSFVRAEDPPASAGITIAASKPVAVDDSTRKVILALLETAQDSDQNVQQESLRAIARFGVKSVPVLVETLDGEDTTVPVYHVLAMLGVDAIDPLIASLDGASPRVRAAVLTALLNQFNNSMGQSPGMYGGGFAGGMGMEGGFGGDGVPAALPFADRLAAAAMKGMEDDDVAVRRAALQVLGAIARVSQDDAIVKSLMAKLKDDDVEVRRNAAQALMASGPRAAPAVTALAAALSDGDEQVQAAALAALANIGPDAKGATEAVLTVLKSPDASMRSLAARALGAMQEQPQLPGGEMGMPGGFGGPAVPPPIGAAAPSPMSAAPGAAPPPPTGAARDPVAPPAMGAAPGVPRGIDGTIAPPTPPRRRAPGSK
jgi:beta-lactamase regulating signal transducer with metallopeptidase domain